MELCRKIAADLVLFFRKKRSGKIDEIFGINKVKSGLNKLNPSKKDEELLDEFYIEKLSLCIMAAAVFLALSLALFAKEKMAEATVFNNAIVRPEAMESKEKYYLNAKVGDVELKDLCVTVEPKRYSANELDEMIPSFEQALERAVLSENESQDFVTEKIAFPETIEGYPFEISFERSDRNIISNDGAISMDIPESGVLCSITCLYSYEDYRGEYSFWINIFPPGKRDEAYYLYKINNALESENEKTTLSDEYRLPDSVEGSRIIWSKSDTKKSISLLAFGVALIFIIFIFKDRELMEKVERRNEEMLMDYPEITGKLTMYIGAGMTIRGAWKKIVNDYEKKKQAYGITKYIYEEMAVTFHEMESGETEKNSLNRFSLRVGLRPYIKLVVLLEQSLSLGSNELIREMEKETREAYENKKSMAEKKGAEAGSKLLIPMTVMLVIVMVTIMYPAFGSM